MLVYIDKDIVTSLKLEQLIGRRRKYYTAYQINQERETIFRAI